MVCVWSHGVWVELQWCVCGATYPWASRNCVCESSAVQDMLEASRMFGGQAWALLSVSNGSCEKRHQCTPKTICMYVGITCEPSVV